MVKVCLAFFIFFRSICKNLFSMKYFVLIIFLFCSIFWACTKDVGSLPITIFNDESLVALVKNDSGKVSWKNAANDSIFTSDAAHGTKQYKLRLNAIASAACTDAGKLPTGGVFPNSSIIVKQLYSTIGGSIESYAVMYKKDGAWLWAKYGASGNVIHSFNTNSSSCTSCHASDKDYTWTFDIHP
jgi:hypothetical protein